MTLYRIEGEVYDVASPEEAYRQHARKTSPSMASGLAQQFNQGITLGGADELQAGVEKLFGGQYEGSLERQRRERAAFQANNPYLSALATGVGATLPVIASTIAGAAGGPPGAVAAGGATGARALKLTLDALYGRQGRAKRKHHSSSNSRRCSVLSRARHDGGRFDGRP